MLLENQIQGVQKILCFVGNLEYSLYTRGYKTSIDVNLIQMFDSAVGTILYLF